MNDELQVALMNSIPVDSCFEEPSYYGYLWF